jgi:Holliday junction resolvasome RuvABC endonuclease subunit
MRDYCFGIDVSINHGAVVCLQDNGALFDYWFMADKRAIANKSAKHGEYIKKLKNPEIHAVHRLECWEAFFFSLPIDHNDYAGIEDYAYQASQGAHQIGEVGGIARKACWDDGARIRLHDPPSIKMFATHDGTADKKEMVREVLQRWPETKEFCKYTHLKNKTITEDLIDAYVIAKLVCVEVQLRNGSMKLSDLHEKEVQVFNRVTKRYPNNLLDREWIQKPYED